MKKNVNSGWNSFSTVILAGLGIATAFNLLICRFNPVFILNENQLLYLFSSMAQVIGGIFGLTLTAYVFFVDKFKESAKEDDTYYDATASLLNRYFYSLIIIAFTCGVTVFLCIVGIIIMHHWTIIFPFIVNESVFLFLIGVVSILIFGTMLLDPGKLDKEIVKLKNQAELFYRPSGSTLNGDFKAFLKTYNMLEQVIIDFAQAREGRDSTASSKYKPKIIQALSILNGNEIINGALLKELNELRMYRNALVHGLDFTVSDYACKRIADIYRKLSAAYEVFKKSGIDSKEWTTAIRNVYDLSH